MAGEVVSVAAGGEDLAAVEHQPGQDEQHGGEDEEEGHDLAVLTGADDDGATATCSVEACICGWLRRQYAIGSLPSIPDYGRAV